MIESILAVDFVSFLPVTGEDLISYTLNSIMAFIAAPLIVASIFYGKYYYTVLSAFIKMIALFIFAIHAGEFLTILLVTIAFLSHFLAKSLFLVRDFREYQINKIKNIVSESLNYDNIMENYNKKGNSKSPEEVHKFAVNLISGNIVKYYDDYDFCLPRYPFYSETLYYRKNHDLRELFKKITKESKNNEGFTNTIPSPEFLNFFIDQANILKQRIDREKELKELSENQYQDEIEEQIMALKQEEDNLKSESFVESVIKISK